MATTDFRFLTYYWRGHHTSLTVVILDGRLPQKLQFKFTLSCEIVQMHSLFRHVFLYIKRRRNQTLTEIENRPILFLFDRFRKTVLGIDLNANAFRGSIQNTSLIFDIFCFIFYLLFSIRITEGGLYWKDGFTFGHSIQHKMLLVRLRVYRSIKT